MLITMSEKELHRLGVIKDICHKRITQVAAATLLNLTRRHVQRLVNAYRLHGDIGLVSKRRNMPSNRRYPPEFKEQILNIVKDKYSDFKPTFACEKLSENHNISLSSETLRQWMVADGLWTVRRRKKRQIYQPRYRRDCVGELIQIDGSHHD